MVGCYTSDYYASIKRLSLGSADPHGLGLILVQVFV